MSHFGTFVFAFWFPCGAKNGVTPNTVFFCYDFYGAGADTLGPILGTKVFPIRTALCMITLRHLLRFILPPDQVRFLSIRQVPACSAG